MGLATVRLGIMQSIIQVFAGVTAGVGDQLRLRRLSVEMIVRLERHLGWIRRRLTSAILRAEAGKSPTPSRPRPQRTPDSEAPTRKPYARLIPLPRREGWLMPLVPCVAESRHAASICGIGLRIVLEGPEMAPYLAHPAVVRALRPICRMLGISDVLPPRPKPAEPVGRISEAQSATATRNLSTQPENPPTAPPSAQPTPKPRPIRSIPPHRLKLPMPRLI